MLKNINKIIFSIIFLLSCSGGGSSPASPDDGSDNNGGGGDSYVFPNATNFDRENQIEIISWNIQTFPQLNTTSDYVKSLLESWNADIYVFQEMGDNNTLISMINAMPEYSYVLSSETSNWDFALVYKTANSDCTACGTVTYNSHNELWADTPNSNDNDNDYENNALYQFASRPPMENYLTWTNGTKSVDLYVTNIHYKCCGDGDLDITDKGAESTRRHYASTLLRDHIMNNRQGDYVVLAGDFNNIGDEQSILNPSIAPLTDPDQNSNYFKMVDEYVFAQSSSTWSWQGWRSSFGAAHLDHIIINQPLFQFESVSDGGIINMLNETGMSNYDIDDKLSDHQPSYYRFYP